MNPWQELAETPTFVLTADQDWAPEWAIERFMAEIDRYGLQLHIFRTSPSAVLDEAAQRGRIDQGWHPNFREGSTHGKTIDAVIDYCRSHFPGARTARSHCFAEDTDRWLALSRAGIVADSQAATFCQGYLTPLVHWTGIVRLPLFFEDDVFFSGPIESLSLRSIWRTLATPGLKILNFHPTFLGCNVPSRPYYEERRRGIFDGGPALPPYAGRGTANVYRELVEHILEGGHEFQRFEQVVDTAIRCIQQSDDLAPAELKPG